jgi:hypothetical protein
MIKSEISPQHKAIVQEKRVMIPCVAGDGEYGNVTALFTPMM